MSQKLNYFGCINPHSVLERTVMEGMIFGWRNKDDQHGDGHRTLNTLWACVRGTDNQLRIFGWVMMEANELVCTDCEK